MPLSVNVTFSVIQLLMHQCKQKQGDAKKGHLTIIQDPLRNGVWPSVLLLQDGKMSASFLNALHSKFIRALYDS